MAERKRTTKKADNEARERALSRNTRKRQVYSVVLFTAGLLSIAFAALPIQAPVWRAIQGFMRGMLGLTVVAVGPMLIYGAVMIAKDKRKSAVVVKMFQLAAALLLISAALQIIVMGNFAGNVYTAGKELRGGGLMAYIFGFPLLWAFNRVGASIILVLIGFIFIMLLSNATLLDFLKMLAAPFRKLGEYARQQRDIHEQEAVYVEEARRQSDSNAAYTRMRVAEEAVQKELAEKPPTYLTPHTATLPPIPNEEMPFPDIPPPFDLSDIGDSAGIASEDYSGVPDYMEGADSAGGFDGAVYDFQNEQSEEEHQRARREEELFSRTGVASGGVVAPELAIAELTEQYSLPDVKLLDDVVKRRPESDIQTELEANGVKLVETLKSFGVLTKVVGIVRGPSVTRYEIQPAPGVKISKITSLTDDIALNLAAAGVRMEAPIPGKSAVGVEVPNSTVDTVTFRELIDSNDFRDTPSNLGAVIGKAISGEIIISDIAKMPHLLIAGTTGSGKSVCVNSIIMSILYRATPYEVRLIMIDPKSVEFMVYSGIPHLLTPVVTDPKKAAGALKWAVNEMTQRYTLFAENNVRDIGGFNEAAKINDELEPMPKIVIFIDELADLMMTAAREVEESICRLAQMARAAGIHLVIATQRPTVNVVTGLIKANIPSRIALKVASQVDSRTIIDTAGADKLLGKGDMLYAPIGLPKPVRVQGCWVSEKEVERVVSFIKDKFELDYDENVIEEIERQALAVAEKDSKNSPDDEFDMDDDKLEDAIEAVIDAGKASTSYLQLKLKLGYGRAARMIDIMEKMGVVGKFEGSKPREVLMTRQDWLARKMMK